MLQSRWIHRDTDAWTWRHLKFVHYNPVPSLSPQGFPYLLHFLNRKPSMHIQLVWNMKSMYAKGNGQGNQFRWEHLDSVTMTTSGWCRHNVPAAEPNFYKPNVRTEALLNGVNGGEDQLSTALLSRKKLQNAMIKHFLTHVSALFLSNCVSLLSPQSIFLWSHFCLFQRKTITTTKRLMQMSPHPTCIDAPFQYALYDLALAVWLHKIIIDMLL